ncbi:Disease resistance protein L6 [Linum perenne]
MCYKVGAVMLAAARILLHKMLSIKKDSNKTNYNNATPLSKIDSKESSNTISPPDLVSLPSVEYEVFLSFRGPDTRDLITNILYRFLVHSKIHTFKDDDELRKGEDIWPNLERAIDQSKIYVPIISKSYAHSKWCLKELAEIVQRQKEDKRRIILPIFYMVDPRDIRHQTGPYQDAFQPYARSFDENTIQSWKDALSIVGSLKGWHVKSNNEVVAILDQVYATVWSHLSKDNSTFDTDEPVGIDNHIKALTDKLSLDSDEGVIMAGIYGLGGVGKTTIAKAVYNKISYRFDRCCFLEDIREKQEKDGNVFLQKKLISDILRMDSVSISDENGGRKMIKERVSLHKVLIVLDDVDENFRFEDILGSPKDFVPGSRFIVTSRNTKILSTLNDNQCRLQEVEAMDQSLSLELFCKHAFKKNSPPVNFKILSNKIVATTGGLPLTLKVIGSLLFKEDIPVWEEKLVQLQETPEFEVIKRLKISYDTLSYEAQQIFLDIACFFIGTNKELPCYMWRDCIYYPTSNINILVQRSMLKVGENNEFQMHDQLRDMGREIVRQENIDHPGMRSRIWSDKDALNVLPNKKGTNQVKAIRVNSSSVVLRELKSECFTNLSELRYLDAKATKLTGDFSNLLPDLMWLRLPEHKNASMASFQMKNLRAEKLKVLNLAGCGNLEKIPSFPNSGSLEILDLSQVRSWSQDQMVLDISKLKKLIVLRLDGCRVSKITGGTIGMMEELQELDLTDFYFGCENSREVFIDIGKLSKLEILRQIEGVGSRNMQDKTLAGIKLPISLKELETSSPIPNLEEMVELEELTVVNCDDGVDIPPSSSLWYKVSKLKHLSLEKTKVNASSSSSLLPTSLTNLDMDNCRVLVYRTLIPNLENLEWVPNLENLENLTEFSIKNCTGPKEIHGLGGLKSLKSLEIDSVGGLTRIHGLEFLMSSSSNCKLEKLRIHGCLNLDGELSIQHEDGNVVESLRQVSITRCGSWRIGSMIRNMSKFPRVRNLELGDLDVAQEDIEGICCLEELEELKLDNLWNIERIPSLSKLQNLKDIEINNCMSLREIEGLEDLKSLRTLHVTNCESLERLFLPTKKKKQQQQEEEEEKKKDEPQLSINLENLQDVDIRNCTKLSDEDLILLHKMLSIKKDSNKTNYNNTTPPSKIDSTESTPPPSKIDSTESSNTISPPDLVSLPSVEYEVFLSFRGPDTRDLITNILYRFLVHSKIHTFKDDDELRIYGIGGVGKTTIAKAVYNKISYRFGRCCFLKDIREKQEKEDGNVILQKKLISDILKMDSVSISDENGGRKMIKERVSRHKVLIVLDDVDENFIFEDILGSPEDFVPGSRFIVTSRNTKILSTLNDNQCQLHEVGAMDHSRSLELFCKHAFKKNSPPLNFKILSNKIVATTGGLPLTLKVIGSLLFKEDIPVWEEKLGTNQVKAIRVNSSSVVLQELKSECFTNLSELRYLDAKATKLTGDFSNLLPDLMWLRLPEHKNASMASFQMKNLRAEKLKVLNLAKCGNLEKIPSFTDSGSLEILDLSYVRRWSQDQEVLNISKLKKLIVLRLKNCSVSKITGGTIGMMEGLRELDLTDFYFGNLREVFIDIGKLSKLEILRQIEWADTGYMQERKLAGIKLPTSLKELETSSPIPNLEELVELEKLTVVKSDHGFDIPPSSSLWCKVSKLKHLSLEKTKVNASSSSSLLPTSLTNLDINNCRVSVWVLNMENMENLTQFSIKDCEGPKEIQGLKGLKSLKSLEIDSVEGLTQIHGLEALNSPSFNCKLEKLRIHGCRELERALVTKGKSILVTKIIENTTRKRVNSHGISHPYSSISHD